MSFQPGDRVRVKRGHHMNRRGIVRFSYDYPLEIEGVGKVQIVFVDLKINDQSHGIEFMEHDLAKVAK